MSSIDFDCAIAGGGLIGLFAAEAVARRGKRVLVLERGQVGGGASRGNAGEFVPDLALPLASPGMVRSALLRSWRKDSALYVSHRNQWSTATFLLRLALNSRRQHYDRYSTQLQALAADSRELFQRLEDSGVKVAVNRSGFLYVYRNRANAEAVRNRHVSRGLPASAVLDRAALLALEPQLGHLAHAGFVLEGMWSLNPSELIDALVEHLRQSSVEIRENCEVLELSEIDDQVRIMTVGGEVTSRQAVVAAGIWSAQLCHRLGSPLQIVAGKGYSFDIGLDRPLHRVIQFDDAHVVATPMGDRVRIAGTMEFDNDPTRLNRGRVESIIAAARGYLSDVDWGSRQNEWVGPRPMTADGMPFIGPVPGSSRIFVAAGHNMHGLSLGPATGDLIADLMSGAGAGAGPGRCNSFRIQPPHARGAAR